MVPSLRIKKSGSVLILSLSGFWYAVNALISLAMVCLSIFYCLAWWIYPLLFFSFCAILYREKWVYCAHKETLSYQRGFVPLRVKEDLIKKDDMQSLVLSRVGRYYILTLKGNKKEWEIERATCLKRLKGLADKLAGDWSITLVLSY